MPAIVLADARGFTPEAFANRTSASNRVRRLMC